VTPTPGGGGADHLADPSETVSSWNVPNGLTVLRVLLVPLFAWLLLTEGGDSTTLRIWAAVVFSVATATDWLDGELARRQGLVTDFGKVADPIADKALMGMALVGLSVLGELAWWITVVILVRELGITLLRFWVIRIGVIPASRGGKLKTALQGLGLLLLILPLTGVLHTVGLVVMYAAVLVTVLTGADYVLQALRLRRGGDRT
jgi:CDP-diacylglycerol--glycerol-3-phosphate 3-phosphatidyltransferase